jgi:hypothetical protein
LSDFFGFILARGSEGLLAGSSPQFEEVEFPR